VAALADCPERKYTHALIHGPGQKSWRAPPKHRTPHRGTRRQTWQQRLNAKPARRQGGLTKNSSVDVKLRQCFLLSVGAFRLLNAARAVQNNVKTGKL
jgi:hypothetical protein